MKKLSMILLVMALLVSMPVITKAELEVLSNNSEQVVHDTETDLCWYRDLSAFTNQSYDDQLVNIDNLQYFWSSNWHMATWLEMGNLWANYSAEEIGTAFLPSNDNKTAWWGRFQGVNTGGRILTGRVIKYPTYWEKHELDYFGNSTYPQSSYPGIGAWVATSECNINGWTVINFHPDDPSVLKSDLYWKNGDEYGGLIDYSTSDLAIQNNERAALWHGVPDNYVDIHPVEFRQSVLFDVSGNNPIGSVVTNSVNSNAIVFSPAGDSYINLHPPGAFNSNLISGTETQIAGYVFDFRPGEHAVVWNRTDVNSNDWAIQYLDPPGSYKSLAYGTDGIRQVGMERFSDGIEKAGMWYGTAESWVSLHPLGATRSGAVAIVGDTQVGGVTFSIGSSLETHAAIWHNTAESFIDMHPEHATRSYIGKTTGNYHAGYAYINNNSHASLWTGDDPDSWFDLHNVLGSEFENGWSIAHHISHSGDEIWVCGAAGTYDSNRNRVNSRAMLWHYFPVENNQDSDGDGFSEDIDCDDNDSSVYPNAPEFCDGIDNDCDDSIDEDFIDLGESCEVGLGECKSTGPVICTADGLGTECNAVPGLPSAEICDGLDNDCTPATPDGTDDPMLGTDCDGTDLDVCLEGVYECSLGNLSCTDYTADDIEICDRQDNDCDGVVPTNETDDDSDGMTECEGDCDDTNSLKFAGNPEVCDGYDNDCDGILPANEADTDGDTIIDCADICPIDPENDADGDGFCEVDDDCDNEDSTGFDADQNGCLDSITGLDTMLPTLVADGVVDSTLENSLLSKVEIAEKSASKENICAAVNQIIAFNNQTEAQRGKKVSDEGANLLIGYADNIIQQLLNMLPEGSDCNL